MIRSSTVSSVVQFKEENKTFVCVMLQRGKKDDDEDEHEILTIKILLSRLTS